MDIFQFTEIQIHVVATKCFGDFRLNFYTQINSSVGTFLHLLYLKSEASAHLRLLKIIRQYILFRNLLTWNQLEIYIEDTP